MKHFKASGLWFLGDAPQNRVAGTLSYSERGLVLRLLGGFRGGWSPGGQSYPVIYGIVGRNPYGEFVTLSDCFTTRTTLSSAGIGSETIRCNRGIAGDAHLRPDHAEFESLDVGMSYLSDWFGRTGISTESVHGERFGLDVHYRQPEAVHWPLDQAVLNVAMSASLSGSFRTFEITEQTRLFIGPLPRITAEQIGAKYVRPLQDLLSFATDTPNAVEGIELLGTRANHGGFGPRRKYHLLFDPIFRLGRKRDRLTKEDMLFDHDEAVEAGLNVFERWFAFTRRHEAFCTVYFPSLYAPPRYLDERFLRLVSALTLLTASHGDSDQRTASFLDDVHRLLADRFTDGERALIGPILTIGPEIEMPARLLGLLREHEPIMRQIVGDDFPKFVRSVCDTLSYAERRVPVGDRSPLQGVELHSAMEKIRILIKTAVLGELGFGKEFITRFIERNKRFVYLRSL